MSQVFENLMDSILPRSMSLVGDHLAAVERMLVGQLHSEIPIIDEMVQCGGVTGGKRFRPLLLLLAAQASGGIGDRHIMLATAVEMIHAATLVHDDIIDNATVRRHRSTINNRWGNQGAVLFGDYLFTQAFYLASLTGSAEACQIIGRATNRVCEGELQQSDAAGNYETSVDEYYQIISKKTAALCACSTRLGSCFSESATEEVERWHEVGLKYGMAFQIVDDVLDFNGDAGSCGKTLGTDLETAKPTLPILLALESATGEKRTRWIERLTNRTASYEEVCVWLNESGSVERSFAVATTLIAEATEFTDRKSPEIAAAFEELGQFMLARVS